MGRVSIRESTAAFYLTAASRIQAETPRHLPSPPSLQKIYTELAPTCCKVGTGAGRRSKQLTGRGISLALGRSLMLEVCVQARSPTLIRFRNRREAQRVLDDIVMDGGLQPEFQIEEAADGSCLIVILDRDGGQVAGVLGA